MCCDSVQKDLNNGHLEEHDDTWEQEFNDWADIDCDLQVNTMLTDDKIAQCIINESKE